MFFVETLARVCSGLVMRGNIYSGPLNSSKQMLRFFRGISRTELDGCAS